MSDSDSERTSDEENMNDYLSDGSVVSDTTQGTEVASSDILQGLKMLTDIPRKRRKVSSTGAGERSPVIQSQNLTTNDTLKSHPVPVSENATSDDESVISESILANTDSKGLVYARECKQGACLEVDSGGRGRLVIKNNPTQVLDDLFTNSHTLDQSEQRRQRMELEVSNMLISKQINSQTKTTQQNKDVNILCQKKKHLEPRFNNSIQFETSTVNKTTSACGGPIYPSNGDQVSCIDKDTDSPTDQCEKFGSVQEQSQVSEETAAPSVVFEDNDVDPHQVMESAEGLADNTSQKNLLTATSCKNTAAKAISKVDGGENTQISDISTAFSNLFENKLLEHHSVNRCEVSNINNDGRRKDVLGEKEPCQSSFNSVESRGDNQSEKLSSEPLKRVDLSSDPGLSSFDENITDIYFGSENKHFPRRLKSLLTSEGRELFSDEENDPCLSQNIDQVISHIVALNGGVSGQDDGQSIGSSQTLTNRSGQSVGTGQSVGMGQSVGPMRSGQSVESMRTGQSVGTGQSVVREPHSSREGHLSQQLLDFIVEFSQIPQTQEQLIVPNSVDEVHNETIIRDCDRTQIQSSNCEKHEEKLNKSIEANYSNSTTDIHFVHLRKEPQFTSGRKHSHTSRDKSDQTACLSDRLKERGMISRPSPTIQTGEEDSSVIKRQKDYTQGKNDHQCRQNTEPSTTPGKILQNNPNKHNISHLKFQYQTLKKTLKPPMDTDRLLDLSTELKELQCCISELNEQHQTERSQMSAQVRHTELSRAERKQLKLRLQDLGARQKQLVEVVQEHKEVKGQVQQLLLRQNSFKGQAEKPSEICLVKDGKNESRREERKTGEITAREETNTAEITAREETNTTEITAREETNTAEITAREETNNRGSSDKKTDPYTAELTESRKTEKTKNQVELLSGRDIVALKGIGTSAESRRPINKTGQSYQTERNGFNMNDERSRLLYPGTRNISDGFEIEVNGKDYADKTVDINKADVVTDHQVMVIQNTLQTSSQHHCNNRSAGQHPAHDINLTPNLSVNQVRQQVEDCQQCSSITVVPPQSSQSPLSSVIPRSCTSQTVVAPQSGQSPLSIAIPRSSTSPVAVECLVHQDVLEDSQKDLFSQDSSQSGINLLPDETVRQTDNNPVVSKQVAVGMSDQFEGFQTNRNKTQKTLRHHPMLDSLVNSCGSNIDSSGNRSSDGELLKKISSEEGGERNLTGEDRSSGVDGGSSDRILMSTGQSTQGLNQGSLTSSSRTNQESRPAVGSLQQPQTTGCNIVNRKGFVPETISSQISLDPHNNIVSSQSDDSLVLGRSTEQEKNSEQIKTCLNSNTMAAQKQNHPSMFSVTSTEQQISSAQRSSPVLHTANREKPAQHIYKLPAVLSPTSTVASSDVFPVSCRELVKRIEQRDTLRTESNKSYVDVPVSRVENCTPVTVSTQNGAPTEIGNSLRTNFVQPTGLAVPRATQRTVDLATLVKTGVLTPGRDVLSLTARHRTYHASLDKKGIIVGSGGEMFRTPSMWYTAVTGAVSVRKLHAYNKILYRGRPLSSFKAALKSDSRSSVVTRETNLSTSASSHTTLTNTTSTRIMGASVVTPNNTDVDTESPVIRAVDERGELDTGESVDESRLVDILSQTECRIWVIDDSEVVPCPELDHKFWRTDFKDIQMSSTLWESVNSWS